LTNPGIYTRPPISHAPLDGVTGIDLFP
jgi:hypothetical protein